MGIGVHDSNGYRVRGDRGGMQFDIEADLLAVADAEGRFLSLNAAWERVLGWTREELIGRPFADFVHPADLARTAAEQARITEPDRELIGFENRYRTRGGEWRWLRWNAHTDGTAWFAVAFDVTEAKLAEQELREAIADDRLLAYSQPIIDQRSGAVVQEELLVRMISCREGEPDRILSPADFLPEAERSGLIRAIDHWMTIRGLELASRGRNVEINLSARTVTDQELMAEIAERLARVGIAARRMIFEITETAALDHHDGTVDLAERLGRLGCMIALDDFGTGFGSLTHLRELPIQMIKIDSSFVGGVRDHPEDRAVVRGVAAIAQELRLKTVAEGVEDGSTYEILRKYGIDRAQGYLIGRPAPI